MSPYILALLLIGLVLLTVTLGSGWITRLPLSYALIYLVAGVLIGPYGFSLLQQRPSITLLERLAEFVVIVSVFGCGLKMNRPLRLWAWQMPVRLIGLLMPISIAALALFAHFALGFEWALAILLGAILAPTDPVLASEVQISHMGDRDELRFGLTSEGGLNDSLAFPFVYFGLYGLKDDNWNNWLQDWLLVDLVWAIAAAIIMGIAVAKAIVWLDYRLQQHHQADELMEDLVALSTILLTYSLTELVNGYGFLAVFISGIVIQRSYGCEPDKRLAQLNATEKIEKLLEVIVILLLGALLRLNVMANYSLPLLLTAGFLLLVVRPLGVQLSLIGSRLPQPTRWLFGWFGVRGVGSLYYLAYALRKGLEGEGAEQVTAIVTTVVALSILVHGTTTSTLMHWYENQFKQRNSLAQKSV